MTDRYMFCDPNGDYLFVTPAPAGGVEVLVTDRKAEARAMVTIPAARLGDFVAGLYRQAGLQVPVLIDPDEVAEDWVRHPKGGAA